MKKYTVFALCCLVTLLTANVVSAQQGGFTGPSAPGANTGSGSRQNGYNQNGNRQHGTRQERAAQAQASTVSQARNLPHKTWVILSGNITQHIRGEYYTFRDSSGEITVDISNRVWQGLTVGPADRVQITGEVEVKRDGRIEIDAKIIRRL